MGIIVSRKARKDPSTGPVSSSVLTSTRVMNREQGSSKIVKEEPLKSAPRDGPKSASAASLKGITKRESNGSLGDATGKLPKVSPRGTPRGSPKSSPKCTPSSSPASSRKSAQKARSRKDERVKVEGKTPFAKLSTPPQNLKTLFDAIVVGSGYGASVSAFHLAKVGLKVCVLEKGKEWLPGNFPETYEEVMAQHQVLGPDQHYGSKTGLYEFVTSNNTTAFQACGLGGGSLINACVAQDVDDHVFDSPVWPIDFLDDLETFKKTDMRKVLEFLAPTIYPRSQPKLAKEALFQKAVVSSKCIDIEDMGESVKRVPLFVNFEETHVNSAGVKQPPCNGCGNCLTGCNTGAKKTLNLTYLASAKAYGAKIHTETEVSFIRWNSYAGLWSVYYQHTLGGNYVQHIMESKHVILGAGAIGTTKILLQSKENGLLLSSNLGKRFSANGHLMSFSYNGSREFNAFGMQTGKFEENKDWAPGPAVTMVLNYSNENSDDAQKVSSLYPVTVPGALKWPLTFGLGFSSGDVGTVKLPPFAKWSTLSEALQKGNIERTITFSTVGYDKANGVITLDEKTGCLNIEVDDLKCDGDEKDFAELTKKFSEQFRGRHIPKPEWMDILSKKVLTAYPLGGCSLGNSGVDGVVNHRGQIFIGDRSEVYRGLHVVDGSVMPCALGSSPAMMIAAFAERCMRLLIKESGWLKNKSKKNSNAMELSTPGFMFSDKMTGDVKTSKAEEFPCILDITVVAADVKKFLDPHSTYLASITGTFTCKAIDASPLNIVNGTLSVTENQRDGLVANELEYDIELVANDKRMFSLEGQKFLGTDTTGEIGWRDTSCLYFDVFEGARLMKKGIVLSGGANNTLGDFVDLIRSIEITNVDRWHNRSKMRAKFGSLFAPSLWSLYSGITAVSLVDPNAPPRERRRLNVNGVIPEMYKFVTEDQVQLQLTRFNGGSKGPVLGIPGLSVDSKIFTLDTIDVNFVEYLVQRKYDIWLLDWRASISLPWSSNSEFNLDQVAQYDIPAAVDEVLRITHVKNIQVVAHCVGSIVFYKSLLAGYLEGKIRNIVCSQVSIYTIGSWINSTKSNLYLSHTMENFGGLSVISAIADKYATTKEAFLTKLSSFFSKLSLPAEEECHSGVCHRISFMYNVLWNHDNMNVATHDTLHETFGNAPVTCYHHLSEDMRNNHLVSYNGKDIYIPGIDDKNRACKEHFMDHARHLNVPIMFVNGKQNITWEPEGMKRSYEMVKELFPNQDYHWYEFPKYRHLDLFMGQNAHIECFPTMVQALDKYSMDKVAKDHATRCLVREAIAFTKMTLTNISNAHIPMKFSCSDKSDKDKSAIVVTWKRKPPSVQDKYRSPVSSDEDPIFTESCTMADSARKRRIVVIGCLHLTKDSGHEVYPEMCELKENLIARAEKIHTLILLGDIFGMLSYAITMSPPTGEQFVKLCHGNEVIQVLISMVKDLSENKSVRVFYIRGENESNLREEDVTALFGEKVRYIPGKLVYNVNTDTNLYRLRFEHGHDYHLFDSFKLPGDDTVRGKTFGYFFSRYASTADGNKDVNRNEIAKSVTTSLLSKLPTRAVGSTLIDILKKRFAQERLSESLLENAAQKEINDQECVLMEDGSLVHTADVLKFRYINQARKKFGSSFLYEMLKGSYGDMDHFIKMCQEDVVVMGHTHEPQCRLIERGNANLLYANCGSWTDYFERDYSYVRIQVPTKSRDGKVAVLFDYSE